MLRRGVRRFNWHGLQEFATRDADVAAFRVAKMADAHTSEVVSTSTSTPADKIDWAKYTSSIQHQDLVQNLKAYHDEQLKMLDGLLAEDHTTAVAKDCRPKSWDAVYEGAVAAAHKSVQKSEEIVANGAKALYISYNNPPINTVSTQEWLDVDQYWQAFVEKHHYYHNHLDCATEDPESKEYDEKVKSDMMKNFKLHDESHPRTKLLYQRPSYEYYSYFKGVFVEHMIYYLTKTGGDARVFPETMPHSWYNDIYEKKFKCLELLQKRRRALQEYKLLREELDLEFCPHDLVGGGEAYYSKMIGKENSYVEMQVARLMSDYMFLSEGIPVQSAAQLDAVTKAGGKGKLYSIGDDVNAFFYVRGDANQIQPAEAGKTYLLQAGETMHPLYSVMVTEFCEMLEQRKSALGGSWFNLPDEPVADAFLRRLKPDGPMRPVYTQYIEEMKAKWEQKVEISLEDAKKKIAAIETAAAEDTVAFCKEYAGEEGLDSVFLADPAKEAEVKQAISAMPK
ncbi:unnamed protein product [Amoebophrya sp. A120]|nr:unnamed protein product [Amoebophrya sp. A120]|eukprot:GSA120T00011202001.1